MRSRSLVPCPARTMAEMYGVRIFIGDFTRRIRLKEKDGWFFGPQGGAYNPTEWAVAVAKDHDYTQGRDEARVMHEISHVVCSVPFLRHNLVPEETLLLQWEGVAAREAGCDPEAYEWYRGTTKLPLFGMRRFRDTQVLRSKAWQEGFARAERVGLLRKVGSGWSLVTGGRPDWNGLTSEDWRLFLKWRGAGHG